MPEQEYLTTSGIYNVTYTEEEIKKMEEEKQKEELKKQESQKN
jgi:hypothetical protein